MSAPAAVSAAPRPHQAPGLSARAERAIRRTTTTTVLLLALAAGILSYAGLRDLALQAGIQSNLAWLLPIITDGLTLVGSVSVVYEVLSGIRAWYSWLLTLLGVSMSVVGNIAASPPDAMSRCVHAAPPIVLALSLEALLRVYRHRVLHGDAQPAPLPATSPTASPAGSPIGSGAPSMPPALPLPAAPPAPSPAAQPAPPPAMPRATPSTAATGVLVTPPRPQPHSPAPAPGAPGRTLKEQVYDLLVRNPEMTAGQIAKRLGKDPSYTRKIAREVRAEMSARTDQ